MSDSGTSWSAQQQDEFTNLYNKLMAGPHYEEKYKSLATEKIFNMPEKPFPEAKKILTEMINEQHGSGNGLEHVAQGSHSPNAKKSAGSSAFWKIAAGFALAYVGGYYLV